MFKPFTLYKRAKELGDEVAKIQGTPEGFALLHRNKDADGPLGMAANELRALQATLNAFLSPPNTSEAP